VHRRDLHMCFYYALHPSVFREGRADQVLRKFSECSR
jgi:hypothetical protein